MRRYEYGGGGCSGCCVGVEVACLQSDAGFVVG